MTRKYFSISLTCCVSFSKMTRSLSVSRHRLFLTVASYVFSPSAHGRHLQAKANGIRPEYAGMYTSLRFHCKHDVWTDARAKRIYDEAQRRLAEERAPLPGTLEERIVTAEREQEIYKEVAEVNPKGRVLGQGCLSQLYVGSKSRGDSSSCSSPADARIQDLEARLKAKEEEEIRYKEEQARKDAARDEEMKEMKDRIAHFAEFLKQLGPAFADFSSSSQ